MTAIAAVMAVLTALLEFEEILFNIDARNTRVELPSLFIPKIEYGYYCSDNILYRYGESFGVTVAIVKLEIG